MVLACTVRKQAKLHRAMQTAWVRPIIYNTEVLRCAGTCEVPQQHAKVLQKEELMTA